MGYILRRVSRKQFSKKWPKIPGRFLEYENKFGNVRMEGCGSKLEASVLEILRLRERAGEIRDIRQQVMVELTCGIRWRVDFSFRRKRHRKTMYAEAKGFETERYRLCLKLWRGGHGPGELEIWKGHWRNPKLVEVVKPKRKTNGGRSGKSS